MTKCRGRDEQGEERERESKTERHATGGPVSGGYMEFVPFTLILHTSVTITP